MISRWPATRDICTYKITKCLIIYTEVNEKVCDGVGGYIKNGNPDTMFTNVFSKEQRLASDAIQQCLFSVN